jgi:hypothetical protein
MERRVLRPCSLGNDDVPDVADVDLECHWHSFDHSAYRSHREAAEKMTPS